MAIREQDVDTAQVRRLLRGLLRPEKGFVNVVLVYGIAISLLTLAVPVAVQTLINTVANIASVRAVIYLSVVLVVTLLLSGLFSALRTYIMEKYERHLYSRLTAEISIRTLLARHEFFEGRRNSDITNRYFDIVTFQKNVPRLLVDGFALVLQMIVGFTLVSFYHPTFFIFNVALIAVVYLAWRIWGRGAIRSAVMLSHAKYATAKWLGDMTAAHEFFKSGRHIDFAQQKTEQVTATYVEKHKRHFKFTFAQTIVFLLLYAFASGALLSIGGWLVITAQLSIGQLVAAELILTAIFFGLSQFSTYLKMYYELCGAADEIGQALAVPQERFHVGERGEPGNGMLRFNRVEIERFGQRKTIDFCIPKHAKVFAVTQEPWLQWTVVHLLKRHIGPDKGWIRLGNHDLRDLDVHQLRQEVFVVDRQIIVECTVADFLQMTTPLITRAQMWEALELVGLYDTVNALENGIDTELSSVGAPLMPQEFLLLKLAAATLANPKVVVITQHFDNMPKSTLFPMLEMLHQQPFTVLYFTNHPDFPVFDYCLGLDWPNQHVVPDILLSSEAS